MERWLPKAACVGSLPRRGGWTLLWHRHRDRQRRGIRDPNDSPGGWADRFMEGTLDILPNYVEGLRNHADIAMRASNTRAPSVPASKFKFPTLEPSSNDPIIEVVTSSEVANGL